MEKISLINKRLKKRVKRKHAEGSDNAKEGGAGSNHDDDDNESTKDASSDLSKTKKSPCERIKKGSMKALAKVMDKTTAARMATHCASKKR